MKIILTDRERKELERLSRSRKSWQALALRARIVLAAADGRLSREITALLRVTEATVGKWRRRFAADRLDGLQDAPRSGAPRRISDDEVAEVVRVTLEETPPDATHWSLRSMARTTGYGASTIHRI